MNLRELLNPKYGIDKQKLRLTEAIEGAKLQLKDRHHNEIMILQSQKMQLQREASEEQNRATIEREHIAGKNARELSAQNFLQDQIKENSQLIHNKFDNLLERQRDWGNNTEQTRKSLYEIEADTIRQQKLSKQQHRQELEKMRLASQLAMEEKNQEYFFQGGLNEQSHRHKKEQEKLLRKLERKAKRLTQQQELERVVLEYNLKFLEQQLGHILQNERVTYDGINAIVMRVIERMLGLGDHQVTDDELTSYVNEAMREYKRESKY